MQGNARKYQKVEGCLPDEASEAPSSHAAHRVRATCVENYELKCKDQDGIHHNIINGASLTLARTSFSVAFLWLGIRRSVRVRYSKALLIERHAASVKRPELFVEDGYNL